MKLINVCKGDLKCRYNGEFIALAIVTSIIFATGIFVF